MPIDDIPPKTNIEPINELKKEEEIKPEKNMMPKKNDHHDHAESAPASLSSRKKKLKPNLFLNINNTMAEVNTQQNDVVASLKSSIAAASCSDSCEKIGAGSHYLYPITGNNVKLYAHPIVKNPNDITSFWSLINKQGINRVVSLQRNGWFPSYLPDSDTKGSERTLSDGTALKIINVSSLDHIVDDQEKLDEKQKTTLKENLKTLEVQVTTPEGDTSIVHVDQFFNWPDSGVIPINQAKKMVDRLPSTDCQIHCEGGLGRTGSLIIMKQLSMDDDLTKDNMIQKIATLVVNGRAQRESEKFVQTDQQLQLLIDFATDKINQKT